MIDSSSCDDLRPENKVNGKGVCPAVYREAMLGHRGYVLLVCLLVTCQKVCRSAIMKVILKLQNLELLLKLDISLSEGRVSVSE